MNTNTVHTCVLHLICIIIILCIAPLVSPFGSSLAVAQNTSFEAAKKGLELMDENKYDEAIRIFSNLISDDFILSDFAFLWRADAYSKNGNIEDALSDIGMIKKKYGMTAAFKGALKLEIEITEKSTGDERSVLDLYQHFIHLFPFEREMQYKYAKALAASGFQSEAGEIFNTLYIEAREFADEAASEFDVSSLSVGEILSRGDNLLSQWDFKEAIIAFKKALEIAPLSMNHEIKENIAYCTFRLKNYKEAAQLYAELNDKYMEAISYLRSGNKEIFLQTLGTLKAMRDPRTGILLIAIANEKRRQGSHADAVSMLTEAASEYPFREDTLWQIGWTQYSSGNYTESEKMLIELYDKYKSNRYLYWMLRSREKRSAETAEGYKNLCANNDYYGSLACLRYGSDFEKVNTAFENTDIDSPLLKRFGILKGLGRKEEALFELNRLIQSLHEPREILLYSRKLQEIGEYKKAISVATMVPYDDTVHELWYPIAYWEIINVASTRFSIDPAYILSIAREESRLDPEARSVSGALGLMQLMPATAERMCRKIKCSMGGQDSYLLDVETNILLGSVYLKMLLNRFGSIPLATAAYNAGENTVQKWLDTYDHRELDEFIEDIPYPETRNYVKKVMATMFQYARSLNKPHLYRRLRENVSISFTMPRSH